MSKRVEPDFRFPFLRFTVAKRRWVTMSVCGADESESKGQGARSKKRRFNIRFFLHAGAD
jgi:hypothetical protein